MAQVRNREHGRDGMKLRSFERADTIATLECVERTRVPVANADARIGLILKRGSVQRGRIPSCCLACRLFVCDVSVLASNWLRLKTELKVEYPLRN
jgi:hypothetical protein